MMNKRIWIGLLAAMLICLPLGAMAAQSGMSGSGMDHGSMEGMDHGKMEGMDHGKMPMKDGMMMLNAQTVDGVKAMAHIKDIHAAMAKMGMDQTHHFMIMFVNTETGEPVGQGTVAVKIKDPDGNLSKPVQLMPMNMGMGEGFGSDITLPGKGHCEIVVGTRLADGKKRQFEFDFDYQ